uniref:Uncharacterized protein n=1 Tax=Fagus sylvatica TaxID=28930 RepID=A0A2N9H1Q3_FAGSY
MGLSRTVDDVVSMSLNHLNSSFVEMINEDSLLPRSAKVSSGTGFGAVEVGFDEIGVGDDRSRPGLPVCANLDLGLGFCTADLGLGWWSYGSSILGTG